ncbi:MAG: sulfatase [Myxococcota bacterium]
MTEGRPSNPTLRASAREIFHLASFVWLVVFATELVHAFKPTWFLASSIIRIQACYAALVAVAVVLALSLVGGVVAALTRQIVRLRAGPVTAENAWRSAHALALVLGLSSLLALSRASHAGSHRHFRNALAGVALAAILLGWRRTRRMVPRLDLVVAMAMTGLWLVVMRKAVGDRIEAGLILGLGAATLAAWLAGQELGRRGPARVAGVAFGLLTVILIARADEPPLERPRIEPNAPLPADTPNVVLFVVDTVRADHTSIARYPLATTPDLDAARRRGATTFAHAWTGATSTIPSIKSLFTSTSPSRWGFRSAGRHGPPRDVWTLPKAMAQRGFRTAGFTSNSLLRKPGFHAGFERFVGFGGMEALEDSYFLADLLCRRERVAQWRLAARLALHKIPGRDVVAWSRDWIASLEGGPFFLYAHIMEPHWPYHDRGYGLIPAELPEADGDFTYVDFVSDHSIRPPPDDPGLRRMIGRYDEEIRFADGAFAELMATLRERGLVENTLVVFASDHGEAFFERGSYGHGWNVHQELAHVPLVVFWPRAFAAMAGPASRPLPEVVETPVSLLDVAPTLAELFALEPPEERFEGRSLLSVLSGEGDPARPLITEAYTPTHCRAGYREGGLMAWIQFTRETSPLETAALAVYDLDRDPRQRAPLEPSGPRLEAFAARARAALHARWLAWPDRVARADPAPARRDGLDEADLPLDQLRVLGYVD